MVLACDFHTPGHQILNGLIGSAVSEGEFVGLGTKGQSEELVAEADSENGEVAHLLIAEELAECFNDDLDGLGVAGTVGDEKALDRTGLGTLLDFVGGDGGRNELGVDASGGEVAGDVVFEATINDEGGWAVSRHWCGRCGRPLAEGFCPC